MRAEERADAESVEEGMITICKFEREKTVGRPTAPPASEVGRLPACQNSDRAVFGSRKSKRGATVRARFYSRVMVGFPDVTDAMIPRPTAMIRPIAIHSP